jgi:eukaryotic-like serine/threonine-protein kinase
MAGTFESFNGQMEIPGIENWRGPATKFDPSDEKRSKANSGINGSSAEARRSTRLHKPQSPNALAPMTDSTRDSAIILESTHNVLAEWSIHGDASADSTPTPDLVGTGSGAFNRPGSDRDASGAWGAGQSVELLAAFALDASVQNSARSPNLHSTFDHPPIDKERGTNREGQCAVESSQKPRRAGFPQPGDELAGFRILTELGRGAFARVFLAEEINLGRRLVAVKVSRPDGNEPQILARLQHGHIVPVHSVCDDPTSGLRVLCMPYFGGADLARVLKTAGGLVPTHHNGVSLVEALDQISLKLPDCSAIAQTHRPARISRYSSLQQPPAATAPAVLIASPANGSAPASRFRWLLSRFVGSGGNSQVRRRAVAAEPDEPSRQYLRSASAIQAAVWIMAQLSEGLEHAHARGLLHRDLKPSNILLAADGTPMLLDFNLAVEHVVDSAEDEIRRALAGGTLPYMSPEHLDAFNPNGTTSAQAVDERSDIYAMGLILFEMLTGELPFPEPPPGTQLVETMDLMVACRRQPPSLRSVCPQVPWSLDALTAKCLAFDPARRYDRARDLAEDLRRFLDNLPMKHCPEPSVRERAGKWARRHPGLCGSTSIAICALVLLGVLGATTALVYDRMQALSARVSYRIFDQDFSEIQFLLNTAGGSNEHLKTGLEKAARTLEPFGVENGDTSKRGGWAKRLTPDEQRRLREQIVELIMLDARAHVLLASQHGTSENRSAAFERAITRLDQAEQSIAEAPSALYAERARYHTALGQIELARRDRERSRQVAPSTCHDLTLLATSLLAAGDRLGAEQALRQALRLDVTSFWTWFVLGHCHHAQGRFLEAAGDFAACAVRGPRFAWVHFNRGLALARAGRPLEASHAYDRALELDPKFSEALVNRAMAELELNQLDAARRDLVRSIELGRDDLVTLTALGETLSRTGRQAEAEGYFADLLAKSPGSAVARVARGFSRIASNPAGAESDLAQALREEPRNAHALYGMAVLARERNPREALEYLERALEIDPNLIDGLQLRALVRARLGDPAALDDIERLLQSPTSYHLYNAACALAVYSEKVHDFRQVPRAVELLARAIASGFPAALAAADPDFESLRSFPEFQRVIARTNHQ